jgi:hypothetical protein
LPLLFFGYFTAYQIYVSFFLSAEDALSLTQLVLNPFCVIVFSVRLGLIAPGVQFVSGTGSPLMVVGLHLLCAGSANCPSDRDARGFTELQEAAWTLDHPSRQTAAARWTTVRDVSTSGPHSNAGVNAEYPVSAPPWFPAPAETYQALR